MPTTKCYYLHCPNTIETHSMFRFPVNNEKRLQAWIENSGNIHLIHTKKEKWWNRYLCLDHFDSCSIRRNKQRTRLIGPAIPQNYNYVNETAGVRSPPISPSSPVSETEASSADLKVLPPQKVYVKRPCLTSKVGNSLSQNPLQLQQKLNKQTLDSCCMDVKCNQTRILIQASRNTFRKQISQINWFKKKLIFPSVASKIIVDMQLRHHRRKYNKEEKQFSLALFNKSPKCYRSMLNKGIVLPPMKTINKWLSESSCLAGVVEDCDSVNRKPDDLDTSMTKEHEEACDLNVKEERGEDCAIVNEEGENYGASVKKEPEDHGASVKKELEEDLATVNEEGEDYGARVKKELEDFATVNQEGEDYGARVKTEREE